MRRGFLILCAVMCITVCVALVFHKRLTKIATNIISKEKVSSNAMVVGKDESLNIVDGIYSVDSQLSNVSWKVKGSEDMYAGTMPVSGDLYIQDGTLDLSHNRSLLAFNLMDDSSATLELTTLNKKVGEDFNEGHNSAYTGKLTLQGTTIPIAGYARLEMSEDTLQFIGSIPIDRAQWEINSDRALLSKDLDENLMSEMVIINFDIVAKRSSI